MRTTQQLSITLPIEMAALIKNKVLSGAYATESEVIREGMRALQERDTAIEQWLREDVAPAYDAYKANTNKSNSLSDASQRLGEFMNAAEQKV